MRKPRRNYLKLVNEICNLNNKWLQLSIVGHVIYYDVAYPLLKLENIGKRKYNLVIQSGIHGDEPEAIQVLINWLQNIKSSILTKCNLIIFPCMNPYGYNYIIRRNGYKQMVNTRLDKSNGIPELEIYRKHYPKRVNLFIDVHGDCGRYGKKEIYAYERIPDGVISPTQKALRKNNTIIPYIKSDTIYKESCKYGVIYNPERDDSIQDYMSDNGCECSLTLEIPGKRKGLNTIYGGVKVLEDIIINFIKLKIQNKL